MTVAVRSFAKINLGLCIGGKRADGFHDLRTIYQTIALHDVIRVSVDRHSDHAGQSGTQIVIRCDDPRVPLDASNTCYRMAALVMEQFGSQGKVTIDIEKKLPVQGGLGAASSNAVATMLALQSALKLPGTKKNRGKSSLAKRRPHGHGLPNSEQLQTAAQVGSDLPLFVIGGTVLGVGRGEEVYPLPDLPVIPMVIVTPELGVSTPKAFADWDALVGQQKSRVVEPRKAQSSGDETQGPSTPRMRSERASVPVGMTGWSNAELTHSEGSDRLFEVGCALSAWLRGTSHAGAPAGAGGRAGSLLSDLVRAGIGNDFEEVVFSQLPELRDNKRALERAGSRYASLSGSGATVYGLFGSRTEAVKAAERLRKQGLKAVATRTLTRREYWKRMLVAGR